MTEDELRLLGRDCYVAFNQAAPESGGRAWRLWAEMCADIPMAASRHIRERIIALDAMPRNFGKAVRTFGLEWRQARRSGGFAREACPDCDRETPGFFTVWQDLGHGRRHRFLVRCRCNQGPACEGMPALSKEEARQAGYLVVPENFEGGVPAYELELAGRLWNARPRAHGKDVPARPGDGSGHTAEKGDFSALGRILGAGGDEPGFPAAARTAAGGQDSTLATRRP